MLLTCSTSALSGEEEHVKPKSAAPGRWQTAYAKQVMTAFLMLD